MSEKLPVGDVLNEAFQFGLHRWATVIRYGWFPVLVMTAILLAYVFTIFDISALRVIVETGAEPEAFSNLYRYPISVVMIVGLGLEIVLLLLFAGVAASVYRLVVLGEERRGLFHLRFDGPASRVFWANIIKVLIQFLIWAGAIAIAFSLTGQSFGDAITQYGKYVEFDLLEAFGGQPSPEMMAPFSDAFDAFKHAELFSLIPIIYVFMKLAPFAPGSASENRLVLFGSFRITFGHFWSILGAYILLGIFYVIIAIIFALVMIVFSLVATFLVAQGGIIAIAGAVLSLILVVGLFFFMAFIIAVELAVTAIIYRRLSTGE